MVIHCLNGLQDISRCEDTLSSFKSMQGQAPSQQLELDIARLEKEIELYSQEKLCYEAQILRVHHPQYVCLLSVFVFGLMFFASVYRIFSFKKAYYC